MLISVAGLGSAVEWHCLLWATLILKTSEFCAPSNYWKDYLSSRGKDPRPVILARKVNSVICRMGRRMLELMEF